MNKNVIVIAIVAIIALATVWIAMESRSRSVQPARMEQRQQPGRMDPASAEAIVQAISSEVPCPEPQCEGMPVSTCSTEKAMQIKETIKQMVITGMDKALVMQHLGMMGIVELEKPELPEGHPEVEG